MLILSKEDTGKAQFCGRTRDDIPILVLNNSRHSTPKDAKSKEREVRFFIYLLEKARKEGYLLNFKLIKLTENHRILVNRIAVLFDRFNASNSQVDVSTCKMLSTLLQKHYPERLSKFIIFPNSSTGNSH